MARNDQQVNVRIPHETIDELKCYAVKNRRSLTAQLNLIIEDWLKSQKEKKV
ncbi:Arc family DNA-binding protein [Acinetobacter gyllenbergii]|nr:Arc family DNA-binding protein [Acinetobacter gyllenbergii]